MNRLGIPQDRIAKRLGLAQKTFNYHLAKMATLPNSLNGDLFKGFTVAQVAKKHDWTDPMVWSLALKGKNDRDGFTKLGWISLPMPLFIQPQRPLKPLGN
jgi:hypothetical protein